MDLRNQARLMLNVKHNIIDYPTFFANYKTYNDKRFLIITLKKIKTQYIENKLSARMQFGLGISFYLDLFEKTYIELYDSHPELWL